MLLGPLRSVVVALTVLAGAGSVSIATTAPGGEGAEFRSVAAPATADRFGDAVDHGSMAGRPLAAPIVGMAPTRSGKGYWLLGRDGGIFSFGDAAFFGSTGAMRLNQPVVGMTASPTGKGYWFVASDGGIFSFGDARFAGSTGAMRLNRPIVGMAATPTGRGYWLVASDGGIFSFGDARFLGGTGGQRLAQPIVGMTATSTGEGYWLVGADGRVFPFGDAVGFGSASGLRAGQQVVGMARSAQSRGYWLGASDGAVLPFGGARELGSAATMSRVVGVAPTATGLGYWLATADGNVISSAAATAAPAVTTTGTFAFLRLGEDGLPVRYDPCQDIHFVINPASAPAGAVDEVRSAFSRLGAATGIRFVDDGTTTETHVPFGRRSSYQPDRYGDRWAPILVSWTTASSEPLLAGDTLAYGGSTSYRSGGADEAYVTGEVVLDVEQSVLESGFGPGLTRGNLVLHELGHVVGLDHVEDRGQLMYPSIHSASTDGYAGGDLAGLSRVGAASGCVDVVDPA